MTIDIKDHFLQSDLPDSEFMKIHKKYFFQDITTKYNINNLIADDNYIYFKIKKGIYGLKQAAKLGRDKIIETLKPFGYYPDKLSPNLW